jgi:hypothetical protein
MTLHVKDATTWKEAKPYVRDGGTWKEITNAYVKDAGSWKEFYTSSTPPSYYYTISTGSRTGSGTTIETTWSIDPSSGNNPSFDMDYVSSSPAGFWNANSTSTAAAFSGTMTSVSKTASAGTTVTITYRLTFESDSGTAEPRLVNFTHQF